MSFLIVDLEERFQLIGHVALKQAQDAHGKIVLYAELGDGWNSADLIYQTGPTKARFQFCNDELRECVIAFWQEWKHIPGNDEWRCMTYVIENGEISIDLKYPCQINNEQIVSDRRPAVIFEQFGDIVVDYSQPD